MPKTNSKSRQRSRSSVVSGKDSRAVVIKHSDNPFRLKKDECLNYHHRCFWCRTAEPYAVIRRGSVYRPICWECARATPELATLAGDIEALLRKDGAGECDERTGAIADLVSDICFDLQNGGVSVNDPRIVRPFLLATFQEFNNDPNKDEYKQRSITALKDLMTGCSEARFREIKKRYGADEEDRSARVSLITALKDLMTAEDVEPSTSGPLPPNVIDLNCWRQSRPRPLKAGVTL